MRKYFIASSMLATLAAGALLFAALPNTRPAPKAEIVTPLFSPTPEALDSLELLAKQAAAHNRRVVERALNRSVNRGLKGDRLTPETLAIQWQGLMPDGTPIEEYEFHQEEALSSMVAKNTR